MIFSFDRLLYLVYIPNTTTLSGQGIGSRSSLMLTIKELLMFLHRSALDRYISRSRAERSSMSSHPKNWRVAPRPDTLTRPQKWVPRVPILGPGNHESLNHKDRGAPNKPGNRGVKPHFP